jgi:molybdenum cofactor cytidylyltransferase
MGTPKQLLKYQGHSLLRHTAEVAIASPCRPIAVVLGAQSDRIQPEVNELDLHIVENQQWAEGMGTSIRVGLSALIAIAPNLAAVVLLLCDQPLVSTELLRQLVEMHAATGRSIVASEYAETIGVPALFDRELFAELMALEGATGAKQVMGRHMQAVHRVPFAAGAIDLDTPADYQQFLQREHPLA